MLNVKVNLNQSLNHEKYTIEYDVVVANYLKVCSKHFVDLGEAFAGHQNDFHKGPTCSADQELVVNKIRMGVGGEPDSVGGEPDNILYGCMVDAPVSYVREVKEYCNQESSCEGLRPPTEVIICHGWELYTDVTQLSYTCNTKGWTSKQVEFTHVHFMYKSVNLSE